MDIPRPSNYDSIGGHFPERKSRNQVPSTLFSHSKYLSIFSSDSNLQCSNFVLSISPDLLTVSAGGSLLLVYSARPLFEPPVFSPAQATEKTFDKRVWFYKYFKEN